MVALSSSEQAAITATINVGSLWERVLGEFLGEWDRLHRTGIAPAEMDRALTAFMEGLSTKPIADMARQATGVMYNQGRSTAILKAVDDLGLGHVVRSEQLDSRTCQACQNLDGAIVEIDSPEYEEYMPPSKCFGGDRCRGFYYGVLDGTE